MTPYEIHLLLNIATSTPISAEARKAKIYPETIKAFVENKLIEPGVGKDAQPQLAQRGRAYLDVLSSVPLPVQVWIDPRMVQAAPQQPAG